MLQLHQYNISQHSYAHCQILEYDIRQTTTATHSQNYIMLEIQGGSK